MGAVCQHAAPSVFVVFTRPSPAPIPALLVSWIFGGGIADGVLLRTSPIGRRWFRRGGTSTRYQEIARRITGVSCPIFGISWTAPEGEVTVARRVLTFLEDRRVLYAPTEMEVPFHCVQSVAGVREYVTQELNAAPRGSVLDQALRTVRQACRAFMNEIDDEVMAHAACVRHYANWRFSSALGRLRAAVGIQVARLASTYGLDVEDDLASVIPLPDAGGATGEGL